MNFSQLKLLVKIHSIALVFLACISYTGKIFRPNKRDLCKGIPQVYLHAHGNVIKQHFLQQRFTDKVVTKLFEILPFILSIGLESLQALESKL